MHFREYANVEEIKPCVCKESLFDPLITTMELYWVEVRGGVIASLKPHGKILKMFESISL